MSFPNKADYRFWARRKAPPWAKPYIKDESSIDSCINAHAGLRLSTYELEAMNLCQLIRFRRNSGANLKEFLAELRFSPNRSRAKYAGKWLTKI